MHNLNRGKFKINHFYLSSMRCYTFRKDCIDNTVKLDLSDSGHESGAVFQGKEELVIVLYSTWVGKLTRAMRKDTPS